MATENTTNNQTINVPSWIKNQAKKYEEEPPTEYLQLVEGNNFISIDMNIEPMMKKSKFANDSGEFPNKKVYTLKNGKKMTVSIVLDRQIIKMLIQNRPDMTIFRSGKGKDSRYSIVELLPSTKNQ